jgi:hypothetical protein
MVAFFEHCPVCYIALVGTRDGRTQSARACLFFSFTWMVLRLPYILYYFQEFKQQSKSIVLGNYLYSSHIYSSQTIVKWVARIDGGIQKKVKEPQPKPPLYPSPQTHPPKKLENLVLQCPHPPSSLILEAMQVLLGAATLVFCCCIWLSGPGFQDSDKHSQTHSRQLLVSAFGSQDLGFRTCISGPGFQDSDNYPQTHSRQLLVCSTHCEYLLLTGALFPMLYNILGSVQKTQPFFAVPASMYLALSSSPSSPSPNYE